MGKFSFIPQLIRKDSNNKKDHLSLHRQTLLDEKIFTTVFKHHPDAVFIVDINGKILQYNQSVKMIFGYTDQTIIHDFERYFFKGDVDRKHFSFALKGEAQNFQAVVVHKNGRLVNVDITYIPLMNHDMQVTAVYGMAKDITMYIQHEKEVNKVKNSLELAQQIGKMGSWDYNIMKDEVYWSKQLFELTGREQTEEYVPNLEEGLKYIHPKDRNRYRNMLKESIKKRQGYSLEYRIIRKDGTVIYVFELVELILDENGNPIRLIGITQDITKRKMVEQKLHESEQRFEHIYDNLSLGIQVLRCSEKRNYPGHTGNGRCNRISSGILL